MRIALHLKGVAHEIVPIKLVQGEQRGANHAALNPIKGVPSLDIGEGHVLTQSMAILRYLDQRHPEPPLLPPDPLRAAKIEAAAMVIATDIHPVNNLKVGGYLKSMGHSQDDVVDWMNHWMREGLLAFAALVEDGPFCFGDKPTLADICLIPQLYNAHRWGTDLTGLNRLIEIEHRCLTLAPFDKARPEAQPDAT